MYVPKYLLMILWMFVQMSLSNTLFMFFCGCVYADVFVDIPMSLSMHAPMSMSKYFLNVSLSMCVNIFADVFVDACANVVVQIFVDLCAIDIFVDVFVDVCVDVCADVFVEACANVFSKPLLMFF